MKPVTPILLIAYIVLPVWSQAVNTPVPPTVIGPGDVLTISALNAEEISKQWRVNASGELSLPMVGTVNAAGRTIDSLEQELAQRLGRYLHKPHVSVFLAESHSHPVAVRGAVAKPGILQLPGPSPLHAVLMLAGGVLPSAGDVVTVTRAVRDGILSLPKSRTSSDGLSMVVDLRLEDVTSGVGPDANILIEDNDLIAVSEGKRRRLVHVSGEVARPGSIELVRQQTVSLSEVIALAGGLTKGASSGKCMLRHINADGVETAFTFVDVRRILSGKVKDIELSDGDILIVPSSNVKNFLQGITQSAVSTSIWVLATL